VKTVGAILAVCMTVFACANPPPQIPTHLQIAGEYDRINRVSAFEEAVRLQLPVILGGAADRGIADPAGAWNSTDLLDHRPSVQLVHGGTSGNFHFAIVRVGGIVVTEHILFLEVHDGSIDAWSYAGYPSGQSFQDLAVRLKHGDECFQSPPQWSFALDLVSKCGGLGI